MNWVRKMAGPRMPVGGHEKGSRSVGGGQGRPAAAVGLAGGHRLDEGHATQPRGHAGYTRHVTPVAAAERGGEVAIEVAQGLQVALGMAAGQAQPVEGLGGELGQVDGVIQLRACNPFPADAFAPGAPLPMVNACEVLDDAPCPTIRLDNREAARTVTEHLIGLGHRRIGMIKGPRRSPLTRDRLAGYHDALEAAGIALDESLLCPGDFTPQSGYEAAGTLIARDDPPTAIFCESDEMAIGAISRIKQAGLSVPGDISVAGFDDIAFASYSDPPLTTIAQPAEAFGRQAVAMLIDVLEERARDIQHAVLPHELVIRGSTATAAA